MRLEATKLPGVFVALSAPFQDERGQFLKTFQAADFAAAGLDFFPRESFVTTSHRNVLRGMHFQLPPAAHAKLVWCLAGRVLDVVLDLRAGSPTFGGYVSAELSPEAGNGFYVPEGCAHGFLALEANSMVSYLTSTVHSPACDAGIRWDSFGFPWPVAVPVCSARDAAFPPLDAFATPFRCGA